MNLYTIIYPDVRKGEKEPSGGYVEVHRFHNQHELELNLLTAISLAKQGYKVRLLSVSDTPNKKNPDAFLLDEQIYVEFKHNQKPTRSAVDNELRDAREQAEHIVLHILSRLTKSHLINAVTGRLSRGKRIKTLWIIWRGKLYRFTRDEVLDRRFRNKIE